MDTSIVGTLFQMSFLSRNVTNKRGSVGTEKAKQGNGESNVWKWKLTIPRNEITNEMRMTKNSFFKYVPLRKSILNLFYRTSKKTLNSELKFQYSTLTETNQLKTSPI